MGFFISLDVSVSGVNGLFFFSFFWVFIYLFLFYSNKKNKKIDMTQLNMKLGVVIWLLNANFCKSFSELCCRATLHIETESKPICFFPV